MPPEAPGNSTRRDILKERYDVHEKVTYACAQNMHWKNNSIGWNASGYNMNMPYLTEIECLGSIGWLSFGLTTCLPGEIIIPYSIIANGPAVNDLKSVPQDFMSESEKHCTTSKEGQKSLT